MRKRARAHEAGSVEAGSSISKSIFFAYRVDGAVVGAFACNQIDSARAPRSAQSSQIGPVGAPRSAKSSPRAPRANPKHPRECQDHRTTSNFDIDIMGARSNRSP